MSAELTLLSVIQGVSLYFLVDATRGVFASGSSEHWIYSIIGLLMIVTFWSRAMIHVVTIVRWPFDFVRNGLYAACTMGQAMMFSRMGDVKGWYVFGAANSGLVAMLFAWDMRAMRRQRELYQSPNERAAFELVQRDQKRNVGVVMPLFACAYIAMEQAVAAWPDAFVAGHGHYVLALLQIAGFCWYLRATFAHYKQIAPLLEAD